MGFIPCSFDDSVLLNQAAAVSVFPENEIRSLDDVRELRFPVSTYSVHS